MAKLNELRKKIVELLKINEDILDNLVYAFVSTKIEEFLTFYHELINKQAVEEIKKEGLLLAKKLERTIEKGRRLEKVDFYFPTYLIRAAPSRNKDKVYLFLIKDKHRYGPIGEIVATENGLEVFKYNGKLKEVAEKANINPKVLESDLEAIKSMSNFSELYRLDSKVRTIYEIEEQWKQKEKTEKVKKEGAEKVRQRKQISPNVFYQVDRELMQKFGDREEVSREEIEEVLRKYGLTLEDFLTFAAFSELEFPSTFYEAEPGKFKRIG